MNLRRQLLLVSLLTLVLPWAGCQFIRETESALREGQQNMLADTAQAIADSLSQFPDEFMDTRRVRTFDDDQIYAHSLAVEPLIDGYADDWTVNASSSRSVRGADGDIRYRVGVFRQHLFLHTFVRDDSPHFSESGNSDRVEIVTSGAAGIRTWVLAAEAPGMMLGRRSSESGLSDESRIQGYWLLVPDGYQLEVRIPLELLGDRLGLTVFNDRGAGSAIRSTTFEGDLPGRLVMRSPVLASVIAAYARDDLRLIVTDMAGWRLAEDGELVPDPGTASGVGSGWARVAYNALLEPGEEAEFAEPDASGRERQDYVSAALSGEARTAWFRSVDTGRAVVAVAQPVWSGNVQTGALVLQQGSAAILSLTNSALGRLVNVTLITTVLVALVLVGYASWLSLRIRRLSRAAESALDKDPAALSLPSAHSGDEIGDLSRSFATVLQQLGNYNDYLRTLASKLSHELRTPLTIVSSSLENLEHENLSADAERYTARARDGAARLKKILDAMSEANRVEELMKNAEPESFDLHAALESATGAYADAWTERQFSFRSDRQPSMLSGSPELLMQLVDKLVDNAVGFTRAGATIALTLEHDEHRVRLSVFNPGPPLPERMRHRLFDSMVSMRVGDPGKHLGLGLYIARLIAEGHGGSIDAENIEDGVVFHVSLPTA